METIKSVRIIVGTNAHAIITTPTRDLSVLLAAGMGAPCSLMQSAADARIEAARIIARAEVMEAAASWLLPNGSDA
jgi:hypothetical protein